MVATASPIVLAIFKKQHPWPLRRIILEFCTSLYTTELQPVLCNPSIDTTQYLFYLDNVLIDLHSM